MEYFHNEDVGNRLKDNENEDIEGEIQEETGRMIYSLVPPLIDFFLGLRRFIHYSPKEKTNDK